MQGSGYHNQSISIPYTMQLGRSGLRAVHWIDLSLVLYRHKVDA